MKVNKADEFYKILERKAIYPVFQPIVNLQTGRVSGYEALSRIDRSSTTRTISDLFVVAEQVGCVGKLEKLFRNNALKAAVEKPEKVKLFLNVDGNIIQDKAFIQGFTNRKAMKAGVPASDIVFEITERSDIENYQILQQIMKHYADQGYEIALDDVGAGHSGLNRVVNTTPDYLKADIELVRDIYKYKKKEIMMKLLLDYCNATGAILIAEGIETEELSFITSAPATSTQDPNKRVIFQRMEEQTNVHIDWTCFVSDQFSDKKNLALAQFGNLPDGLFNAGMSDYDLLRYAKQGIIIPLENLIDKYMPNLQAVFEKYPEYRTMCTAPDGHIYSFPWIEQLGSGKEAIQAIGDIPYINKKWLDYLGLEIPTTTDELEQVLIQFRDHADDLKQEFSIEGDVIPMSFIINNGDQDPSILINGFGDGYGDTGDHFAVTDEGKVIYTTVQEGYKEGIKWLHKLVTENLIDPDAFTQEWSTYVAKGKNHRYGLCFTWDIANIDNNTDYVMLPALTGPDGMRNITRQNNSETSGFDRGRCVLTTSCRNTALAAAWIDQMYAPLQSPQNNWGTYGEKDSFNIFELSVNKDGEKMLKHMDLGDQSPVEVREAQSVNGPLAILNEYYDVYVTQPEDAKWRLDNMHETYLQDMNSKYVYPNVFMSIDDTNKVSQYDTDIKKYAEQKKADWILNGGIDEEWDSYLKKMEKYGLSDYLSIKQKYFDQYQDSLSSEK